MIMKKKSKLTTNKKLSKTVKYKSLMQSSKPGKTGSLASKISGSGWD